MPNSEELPRACAMVNAALTQNVAIRPLWVDILLAWRRPGCAFYESFVLTDNELRAWAEDALQGTFSPLPQNSISRTFYEWQQNFSHDPDIIYLNNLVNSFILKGFNGPIQPTLRRVLGAVEYLRAPRYKVLVKPKTAPILKQAVLFLTWCEYKGIDLRELDRERMGSDYELVTSGEKPTTIWGRKRKLEINALVHNAGLSFISEKAIQEGANKWYSARVIKGSIVEAASDHDIAWAPTFENEIKPYDHIARLC